MFAETYTDPIAAFLAAWSRVRDTAPEGFDPSTVALATADVAGRPASRMVLLKGADERGFVFFTNYGSRKARELDGNPRAALCFFWHWMGQQVRVEGAVERVSAAESDEYFATRPRGSQLGAWASRQSAPVDSRATLEERLRVTEARFDGGPVPRPPFWGGYCLVPERIEFWQEGEYRLHDRLVFTRTGEGWQRQRLYP
jgi:pyridoxamine 5'-phosphate oxidase